MAIVSNMDRMVKAPISEPGQFPGHHGDVEEKREASDSSVRRASHVYGSENTYNLFADPCFNSGARRLTPVLTRDAPVLTTTYCLPLAV